MERIAVYPGTFDPITLGHENMIQRAAALFDKVIIAVATNQRKKPYLSLASRIEMVNVVKAPFENVIVLALEGLLVDFARKYHATMILRGLRMALDFDYEYQLAGMNRQMDSKIETLFLPALAHYNHISSTIVREIISLGGDVSQFVPRATFKYYVK